MISGNEVDFYARIGDFFQRGKDHVHQPGGDPAPEKQVASMDDRIDFVLPGRLEGSVIVGKEIFAAAPPLNSGFERVIEAEMAIG